MTINMKKNMNKREYFFLAAVCNNKVVDLEVTESSFKAATFFSKHKDECKIEKYIISTKEPV